MKFFGVKGEVFKDDDTRGLKFSSFPAYPKLTATDSAIPSQGNQENI